MWKVNVLCSTIEAVTATTQLIGTIIGSLSILWSHCSGIYHMVAGPLIGGGCGGAISQAGDLAGVCGNLITRYGGDILAPILGSLGVK